MHRPGGGLDDEDHGPPDGPGEPVERAWVHPSEVGMVQRGQEDRRRSSRLAGVLVVGGLGLLGVAVVLGFGWGQADREQPVVAMAVSPSMASLTVVKDGVESSVTGIVLDDEGHVAASAAAVDGATEIWATCGGEPPGPAAMVASDRSSGVAVLRLDRAAGRPAIMGDSPSTGDRADMVQARGGERSPSTRAVVVAGSGMEQVSVDGTVRTGVFVTDDVDPAEVATTVATLTATAPPSDSGVDGAVFDERGRFLGLVIGADGDGAEVAQPATVVRSVAESLIALRRLERAWIGVEATDLGRDEALSRALDGGAVVVSVIPDGPAAAAGLVPGDIVVTVDGRPVVRMEDLVSRLREAGPGRTVELTWIRGTERRSAPVTVTAATTALTPPP